MSTKNKGQRNPAIQRRIFGEAELRSNKFKGESTAAIKVMPIFKNGLSIVRKDDIEISALNNTVGISEIETEKGKNGGTITTIMVKSIIIGIKEF